MSKELDRYEFARCVLRNDFIPPEEIARIRNVSYDDSLKHYHKTIPSEETISWCRAFGFMLLAGPPKPMNFFELLDYNHSLKYHWLVGHEEDFKDHPDEAPANVVIEADWLMISKRARKFWSYSFPPSGTLGKKFTEPGGEYLPSVAEILWALITVSDCRSIYVMAHEAFIDSSSNRHNHDRQGIACCYIEHLYVHIDGRRELSVSFHPKNSDVFVTLVARKQ